MESNSFLKTPRELSHPISSNSTQIGSQTGEIALAAVASYKQQKEVGDFITFMLEALKNNASWLNTVVSKQNSFRCALMTGAGPNRFQIQEIIYPSDNREIKLEVELNESEDFDKVALAAIINLTNAEMDNLLKYLKTKLYDNHILKKDLIKGKNMGLSYVVLRPISGRQYRVAERISIDCALKLCEPAKKKRKDDKALAETILRKPGRHVY